MSEIIFQPKFGDKTFFLLPVVANEEHKPCFSKNITKYLERVKHSFPRKMQRLGYYLPGCDRSNKLHRGCSIRDQLSETLKKQIKKLFNDVQR